MYTDYIKLLHCFNGFYLYDINILREWYYQEHAEICKFETQGCTVIKKKALCMTLGHGLPTFLEISENN